MPVVWDMVARSTLRIINRWVSAKVRSEDAILTRFLILWLGSKTTQCRIPSSLCSPDPSFTFDLSPEKLLSIPVEKLMSYTSNDPTVKSDKLLMLDTTLNPPIPLGIKSVL